MSFERSNLLATKREACRHEESIPQSERIGADLEVERRAGGIALDIQLVQVVRLDGAVQLRNGHGRAVVHGHIATGLDGYHEVDAKAHLQIVGDGSRHTDADTLGTHTHVGTEMLEDAEIIDFLCRNTLHTEQRKAAYN